MESVGLFLIVIICSFEIGTALECYVCDDCGDDASKYEGNTCSEDGLKCATIRIKSWALTTPVITHRRRCASTDACEVLAEKEKASIEEAGDQVADRIASIYECKFCDTDLCNDASLLPE